MQALLAPGGNKVGLFNGLERALAQGLATGDRHIHADKPLGRGAVDQRRLVAPAVHVAVLNALMLEQRAHFLQLGDDGRVGLPDKLATEERQILNVDTVALHRAEDVIVVHAVLLAGAEVVFTIGRGGVNDTGTGVQLDIVSQVNRRQAVIQRVTEVDQFKRRAGGGGEHLAFQAIARQTVGNQVLGQHQQALTGINQRVIEFGVGIQRLVGRNGPGCCGPDDHGGRLGQRIQTEGRRQLVGILDREGNINGFGLLVLILDLGLGQRRATVKAPVDRLEALEHYALLDHAAQRANLARLVGIVHGQVGIVPVTQHAQTNEVGLLQRNLLAGIFAAQRAHLIGRQVLAVGRFHLVLDRQTVTVPTRHVGRIEARQGLGTDDHVLDDLVECMTDMNNAVGVRGAIVQDKLRTPLADFPNPLVQAV